MQENFKKKLERNSDYRVIFSNKAMEMERKLVDYLINVICSSQAAIHLLDEIDKVIERLQENPYQFPKVRLPYVDARYRMVTISTMNYIVIYKISNEIVYIMGIFHSTENYMNRLEDFDNA